MRRRRTTPSPQARTPQAREVELPAYLRPLPPRPGTLVRIIAPTAADLAAPLTADAPSAA